MDALGYRTKSRDSWVSSASGSLCLTCEDNDGGRQGWWSYHADIAEDYRQALLNGDVLGSQYLWGFSYRHKDGNGVCIPYYFFILVFSGILFLVWRKTGKRKVGAFPVEVKHGAAGS